ncbi:angiopoietin-like protein 8 isoform X2 [Heterocephalus glaber]|uniref:Angiopoietin-like protein 8 isoform X2 n=1 Tax=Heterocephalus glaber TaxID=10181 RepID=A0A0P6IZ38_HETGA|nr:angiopoietin-like protein 8 isoform X2 [Heterocephalus glaber]
MPMLTLCLLWVLSTTAWPAPVAPIGDPEPAQHEELTLLFHGALQLAQALNSVYKATEARLMEARHSLGLYGHALQLLGLQVSQGQDATQELRTNLLGIQMDEDTLQLQAKATAQELAEVAQAQQVLQDSVQRLDGQLRGAWLGRAHHELETLKVHADKQSHLMWVLTGHMQRQRREMAEQQQWLQQIEERLHTAALPA